MSDPEVVPQEFVDLLANSKLLAELERGEAADPATLIRRESFGKHFRQ